MKIAVITGASSGIGREFVRRIDSADVYDEIWVIARRRERLEALAAETNAVLRILALDLTKEESIDTYKSLLEKEKPSVSVLVNCSGFGKFGAFADYSLEDYYDMIDLNVKALVAMTYVTLPYMAPGGQIYQIDSLSAFHPVPYINVYGSSKAYVLNFSRALGVELKAQGIHVMAVAPGWIQTEFFDHAVHDDTIKYMDRIYPPEAVIEKAMKDLAKNKSVSILGFPVRIQVRALKHLPTSLVMKIWCKQQGK